MVRTRHSGDALYGFDDLSKIKKKVTVNNKHEEYEVSPKRKSQRSEESSPDYKKHNAKKSPVTSNLWSMHTRRCKRNQSAKQKEIAADSSEEEEEEEEELETSKESPKSRHKDEAQTTKKKTDKSNQKPLLPTRRSTRKRSLVFISSELTDHHDKNDSRKRKRKGAEEMEETLEFTDMYSRVKRNRRGQHNVLGGMHNSRRSIDDLDDSQDNHADGGEDGDEDDDDDEEEEEDNSEAQEPPRRSYFLREHKPRTKLFEAPPIDPMKKRNKNLQYCDTPRSSHGNHASYRSPAHRNGKMRRTAFHGSSSTSSSSDSSDDERRFEIRKAKSMTRARNRCLPMNFGSEDIANTLLRDRMRIGSSLADVDPMTVDKTVNFNSVGGLGKHISALKEMIIFPLLYPEVFERFKISPPRGVLFYGAPGTGKTLVARALANECSTNERRVSFYMRKGADCLSKWVGESERQLRLLFDQAYQTRPSIIFFDEIDGLAPVRSSRQDQIHSSIVSTLLALMDGLDSRDEIVVIGATNRIDAIDPALRRPGRFDREFNFPLPSLNARIQILSIMTKEWNPKLSELFVEEVSKKCVGYCGADIKALCTEAAFMALRRRYPQIYNSSEKLQLDVTSIRIKAADFHRAMQVIVPTAQRSNTSPRHALSHVVKPLLVETFDKAISILQVIFPTELALTHSSKKELCNKPKNDADLENSLLDEDNDDNDYDDDSPCIFEPIPKVGRKPKNPVPEKPGPFFLFTSCASQQPSTYRPRLLLAGRIGQGQSVHLAPAIMQQLEQLPVYVLDLASLFAVSVKTPEESCAQIFREAKRTSPSILYLPHVNHLWSVAGETLKATFLTMVDDLDPCSPILILATSEIPYDFLEDDLRELFDNLASEVLHMSNPNEKERREFFCDLLLNQATKPPLHRRKKARVLEKLPPAPPPPPRKLTDAELMKLQVHEESTLRELRLFLRDIWNKLAKCRKFGIFMRPVDIEDVPDYYEIVKQPMDLNSMLNKIDNEMYQTAREFLDDVDLIWRNALEYNPDSDTTGKAIRHRVCALRDMAYAMVNSELNPEFAQMCQDIVDSRKRRGEINRAKYIFSMQQPSRSDSPLNSSTVTSSTTNQVINLPSDYPTRFSRRVRGMEAESQAPLEVVAKIFCQSKSPTKSNQSKSISKSQVTSTGAEVELEWDNSAHPTVNRMPRLRLRRKRLSASNQHAKYEHDGDDEVSGSEEESCTNKTRKQTNQMSTQEASSTSSSQNNANNLETIVDLSEPTVAAASAPPPPPPHPYRTRGHDHPSPTSIDQQTALNATSSTSTTTTSSASSLPSATTTVITSLPSVLLSSNVSSTTVPTSISTANTLRNGLDSGIGSAIESNGESLDSLDQAKTADNVTTATSPTACEEAKDDESELNESTLPVESQETECDATTFQISITGDDALANSSEVDEASAAYNKGLMSTLLDQVVVQTKGYTVERLEKLYSLLSQCIYRHRLEMDKSGLCLEMERKLLQYTSQQNAHLRRHVNMT